MAWYPLSNDTTSRRTAPTDTTSRSVVLEPFQELFDCFFNLFSISILLGIKYFGFLDNKRSVKGVKVDFFTNNTRYYNENKAVLLQKQTRLFRVTFLTLILGSALQLSLCCCDQFLLHKSGPTFTQNTWRYLTYLHIHTYHSWTLESVEVKFVYLNI